MNDTPPTDDQGDGLEELYRKSAAQHRSRPSAKTRRAILEHAARTAPGTRSAAHNWRRAVLFGSLAAAAIAGLLVGPQFLHHSAPPESVVAETSQSAPMAIKLPENLPAPRVQARAMQMAPRAPAAVPEKTDHAPSGVRDSAVIGGIPAAATEAGAAPVVTGMRARQTPFATSGGAAESAPDASVPVDARDSDGRTALMLAVLQGRLDTVVALLRRGADPNAADRAGVTPLQAARANNQPAIADALLRAGAQ